MQGAELMNLIQTVIVVGTGAFVLLSAWDKYLKAQIEIAKEKSVGAKAIADLTAQLHALEKTVKHWDETYKEIIGRFLDYLNNKK